VPLPLISNAGFETAIKGLITKSDQARRREELYVRVIVRECHLEITAIGSLKPRAHKSRHDRLAQPRLRRPLPPKSRHQTLDVRDSQREPLIQATTGIGCQFQRVTNRLHVLLRHRPPQYPAAGYRVTAAPI
jgi:hypothetical protein